jgi:hypothetical protein
MSMETVAQKYRQAKISDLVPHPRNPNLGDVGAIYTSIEATGFYGAVLVQKSSQHIIAGNHRVIAAQQSGATSVPIIELDVDDETALRILLADNRIAALAHNDEVLLTEVLRELAERDALLGTGYDGDDLDALLKGWTSDMQSAVSDKLPTTEGRFIVTFDEAIRDDVRGMLESAISSTGLAVKFA